MYYFIMDLRNKFVGCIYGLAIGDALGYPSEFIMDTQLIKEKFGDEGITDFEKTDFHPPGTFTDDTQMTIALSKAILKCDDFEVDNFMTFVSQEFVSWMKSPTNNRSPGHTCMTGCENLEKNIDWRNSGVKNSKGCGTCMRIAPLGLVFSNNFDTLFELSEAASICTHGHPTGVAAGVGMAYAVALALKGEDPLIILDKICEIPQANEEYVKKIQQVKEVLDLGIKDALEILGPGWVAEEALAASLYLFIKFPDDYETAVLTAVNTVGDSDTLGCMVGALVGARTGEIPNKWILRIEKSDFLKELALGLFDKFKLV
jgi:ADP-ribosylglycohydrolase